MRWTTTELVRLDCRLRQTARRLVPLEQDAEDLAQDLWIDLLRKPSTPEVESGSWLHVVLRHAAHRRSRQDMARKHRESLVARFESVVEWVDPEFAALGDRAQRVLERLHDPYGTVLRLSYLEGRSVSEIAAQLRRSAPAVRLLRSRGLRQVRELMRPQLWTTRAHGPVK